MKHGALTNDLDSGIEAGVKVRPTEEELKWMDSWPCKEFRSGWDSYFKDKPDKPVMHYSVIAGWFGDHMLLVPSQSVKFRMLTAFQHASRKVLHNVPFPRVSILSWIYSHYLAQRLRCS